MIPRDMLPELVQDSKLEAKFHPNGDIPTAIVHTKSSGRGKIQHDIWVRERKLGQGGYGIVWLERNNGGGQEVSELRAVKELNIQRYKARDCVRELEALAKFSQEKFVRYFVKSYGWFESNNHLYIAMEYCEDGDLRSYLKEHGRLPEGQAQDTAWQILQGLQFMHQNKFAHRDLKPANILIKSKTLDEWHVKICDLGLSKRIEGATASTVRGTPGFTPPEIFLGVSKDSSTVYPFAIDMWCLGETVYNILTLEPAFNNLSELLDYSKEARVFPVKPLERADVSDSCVKFIRTLMQPNPELRLTAQEANEDHWMVAASELTSGLPDFLNLPLNSSSDLIASNQAKVDDQPSGSWSTSTQQIPQRRGSFKTTQARSRSRSLDRKDRKVRSSGSLENRRLHHGARQSDLNENQDYSQMPQRRSAPLRRLNEYFVPGDGIDREVISEDICFYLGPDARVRSGDYQHPQTGQIQAGYFINAYATLTTAHISDLISDLKAYSQIWAAREEL